MGSLFNASSCFEGMPWAAQLGNKVPTCNMLGEFLEFVGEGKCNLLHKYCYFGARDHMIFIGKKVRGHEGPAFSS